MKWRKGTASLYCSAMLAGSCACKPLEATNTSVYFCSPWTANPFPFGSEFAWDSTGQEEIYVWSK